MIYFPETNFAKYFNKKIHDFLTTEFIELRDSKDSYDSLDLFFPDYLLREQKDKCLSVAEELYYWSEDNFTHKLTPIHQEGLYNFLRYVEGLRKENRQMFDKIYYSDPEDIEMIKQEWNSLDKIEYKELFTTMKGFRRFIHDIETIIDHCFEDIDFVTFPYLLGNAQDHEKASAVGLADYYSELLPRDIAEEYLKIGRHGKELTLFENVGKIISQIAHNVTYRDHYKSFWGKNGTPLGEIDVCVHLEQILFAYFQESEVDIDREINTGLGRVDFRLKKHPSETVLLEVKLGNSQNLLHGYEKQLIHYMEAQKCSNAYYVIICRDQNELQKAEKFLENAPTIAGKNVIIKLLNVARKRSPSSLR